MSHNLQDGETVAVVYRRPCGQHLACCSANSRD